MKSLKNSKYFTKIAASFACIAAVALIVGGICLANSAKEPSIKGNRQNVASEEKSSHAKAFTEISAAPGLDDSETEPSDMQNGGGTDSKTEKTNNAHTEKTDTDNTHKTNNANREKTEDADTENINSSGEAETSPSHTAKSEAPDMANSDCARNDGTNLPKESAPGAPEAPASEEPDIPAPVLPKDADTVKAGVPAATPSEDFDGFPVIEPDVFLPEDADVSLSLEFQQRLGTLAKAITFRCHSWDNEMGEGYSYPVGSVRANMEVIDVLSLCALSDPSYYRYLPSMEIDPNASVYNIHYERYFDPAEMQLYMKNVFGIENANMAPYIQYDKVVSYLFTDFPLSKFELQNAVLLPDGACEITGNGVVFYDVYACSYPFRMVVKENLESPFGFQLLSITFQAPNERPLY